MHQHFIGQSIKNQQYFGIINLKEVASIGVALFVFLFLATNDEVV
jgi:hypothetical protein